MRYETVIGLEVHVELATASKIFCGCSTKFGQEINTQCCPICLGMPGVLPKLNKKVVDYALKAALALNCKINQETKFDRKNYFYPDLPKAYQISQYDKPIGEHGYIDITVDGEVRRIGITRIHMEEDAGKLLHESDPTSSLIDLNRTGVPLIEIVSEPDLRSPEEAREYLMQLRNILKYIDVSDVKMEEGSLRCDANISLRPYGQETFGTKTELKNLNSFKWIAKGIEHEMARQKLLLDSGEKVTQETRRFDVNTQKTVLMRSKEEAHDYRYFPDPDLVTVEISDDWIKEAKASMPELPEKKKIRFMETYQLPEYDAGIITGEKELAQFFEDTAKEFRGEAKVISNWVMGDLMRLLNSENKEISDCAVTAKDMASMLNLIEDGTISGKIAKTVFEEMFLTGKEPKTIIAEKGLVQISDVSELEKIIDEVIGKDIKSVRDFQNGNKKALGFFMGQVMRQSGGKANPKVVNELLAKKLNAFEIKE